MKRIVIVAIGRNSEIGKDNTLLWHLPEDMKFFRETTTGHAIISGRKNYESIPEKFRPLKDRLNIVVTRKKDYEAPGAVVANSLQAAFLIAKETALQNCFIIGGGQIYKEVMAENLVDELLVTQVDGHFDADVFFPEIDASEWQIASSRHFAANERNPYNMNFVRYTRKS